VSDNGTQGIDATTLVALLLVAVVLDASDDFLAELHNILARWRPRTSKTITLSKRTAAVSWSY